MVTWFEELGFDVELLLWARQPTEIPSDSLSQLTRHTLLTGGGYGSANIVTYYPVWWRRVSQYLSASGADLVYAYDFESAYGCIHNTALAHKTFIYDIADNFHLRHNFPPMIDSVIQALEKRVLDVANLILVPDECRITELEEPFRDKISVVANAPRVSETPSIGYDLPGDELVVYWNGWLDSCRGRDQVMKAVAATPGVRLLVAGSADGALEQALHELGIAVYLGQLSPEDALKWYRAADVVFTFYEPSSAINRLACSSKWYDAMLSGRAILVNSEVAASVGLVASGIAYSCPYDDVEQLKGLLRRMVADRQELREMGRRARELFERRYSWDAYEPQLRSRLDRAMTLGRTSP
jgi:glycosyltransferase involved in cell wall biosynthesis